jgi:bifunctional UDP-N-acetylglucosamine pyrophosphorylase/glucosamine-1-phosphate N-acetyltransferase
MRSASVILAAGASTRMKSSRTKVLHELCGRPVVSYVIDVARAISSRDIVVVRGPAQKDLKEYLNDQGVGQAVQKKALGTANALQAALPALKGFKGIVLVLCGDVPLMKGSVIAAFVREVASRGAKLGMITMQPQSAAMYGRVVRDLDGSVIKVVEAKDATDEELKIREVNSGILCFDFDWLSRSIKKIGRDNAKGEYYLTDLVGIALKDGVKTYAYKGEDADDFMGINTRVDLARARSIMRGRINRSFMLAGVGIMDPDATNIDSGVRIGTDTEVWPYTFLSGDTRIGSGCVIESGVTIVDSVVGDGVHIKANTVIESSIVSGGAVVGPFARLRPDSKIGPRAKVGNFVELKKCEMKEGAKANHLTYLGDATVGARANVGCGTITCNYDGVMKYRTTIGDEVFVGSDTQFVAPVKIGRGAFIGAGSTITKDVPAMALALTRCDQKIVKGWAKKRKR